MKTLLVIAALSFSALSAHASCDHGVNVVVKRYASFQIGPVGIGAGFSRSERAEVDRVVEETLHDAGLQLSKNRGAYSVTIYVNPRSGSAGFPVGPRIPGSQPPQEQWYTGRNYQESLSDALTDAIRRCVN